jgi:hypothetical protein
MQSSSANKANGQPLSGNVNVSDVEAAPQFHVTDIKRFEWRFKHRPSLKEMLDRSIISKSQAAVIEHEANLEDMNQSNLLAKNKTIQFLEHHLSPKSRISKAELEHRNILPQGYFASIAKKLNRRRSSDELRNRLIGRPNPKEIISRGILTEEELQKDYEIVQQEHEKHKKQMSDELNQKIQSRPSLNELGQKRIISPMKIETGHENDNINEDVKDAKSRLEQKLNERPSLNQIAESGKMDPREFFLDHQQVVKEHDEEVKLIKKKLNDKINARPSRYEMAELGKIDPLEFVEDHDQVVLDHQIEVKNL